MAASEPVVRADTRSGDGIDSIAADHWTIEFRGRSLGRWLGNSEDYHHRGLWIAAIVSAHQQTQDSAITRVVRTPIQERESDSQSSNFQTVAGAAS